MRKAGQQLYDSFKNFYGNEIGQDILETSIKGSLAAVGQASLTDMSPEEIVLATAIGMSGAMAARPIGRRIGNRIGRSIDNQLEKRGLGRSDSLDMINSWLERGKAHSNKVVREASDLTQRRFLANYAQKDGSLRGDYEGTIGEIVRETSDDATQIALAVLLPGLFAREETDPNTEYQNL